MHGTLKGCVIMLWFLFVCGFLQLGSALHCTVVQHDDHTTYSIARHTPDEPLISAAPLDCEYTWANASHHVMANNEGKTPDLVLTNSINTLVTSRCIDQVVYAGTCHPEGEHFTTNCTISCHPSAWRDKVPPPYSYTRALIVIVVLAAAVVVVMGLLVLLCNRCKKNKDPSSGQPEITYSAV